MTGMDRVVDSLLVKLFDKAKVVLVKFAVVVELDDVAMQILGKK